ncbi:MAG: phospholipase/Carboxylesterase [Bacteroidetes bacterium]|jgi:predicted esterase|nr:phospholipase/Carboxylesterase [Bacteroidota bacterium]
MIKKNITVSKTARYFLSSELSDGVEEVWFVCHGYAQLASYFINSFEALANDKVLIVAPEGFHRFYWNGFSGRVVASWMTKEDRSDDIHDYVNYLDTVYKEVISSLNKKVKINVLGFSQGTATVCRWLTKGSSTADNLIIWAGSVPDDLDLVKTKAFFKKVNLMFVVGDKDEFISEIQVENHTSLLKNNDIDFELIRFRGKHEIDPETLIEISEKLRKL